MLPRMQEIFALIGERLKSENLFPLIPAGIVIAGGGAQTTKIAEIAKRELNLSARIGKPVELQGLTNDITKPEFATSIGLLHLGRKQKNAGTTSNFSFGSIFKGLSLGSIPSKIGELFKSLMP